MPDTMVDLISRIYEAAVLPEFWPLVLTDLARFGGADAGVLFTSDLEGFRFVASPNFSDSVDAYIEGGWLTRTDRTARLLAKRHAGFVTDLDVYTPEEFDREPVFREFFNPRGFGMGAATVMTVPTGDQLVFDVERAAERGPFPLDAVSRLDGLRPHLARAATMSARLRLQTVRAAAQALETVGLAAAVLGRKGRPLAMSQSCEQLLENLILDRGRLVLMDATADPLLVRALADLSSKAITAPWSIPLAARDSQPPTILHLLPSNYPGGVGMARLGRVGFAGSQPPLPERGLADSLLG